MKNQNELLDLLQYGLNFINKSNENIRASELFLNNNEYINIEIEENSIKNSEIGEETGLAVRIIDNRGTLGFSFTNFIEKKPIKDTIRNAIKMMKAGTPDPDFKDLPSTINNYPSINRLYDKDIEILKIEDCFAYVEDLIKLCNNDDMAISQTSRFKTNISQTFILNTNGIEISGKETVCSIMSNIIVKDKTTNETSFGYNWQSKREIKELDVLKVGQKSLEDAKSNLNRKKVKNMKVPLVLTPFGTLSLIMRPIASAIDAETYQYNRSFLVGKKGKKIGTPHLTIEDNALMDGSSGSYRFDDEGVPCKDKTIVEEGKFLEDGLLHNSYTANKDNTESTGNGFRSSYSSTPSIGTTNFVFSTGDIKKDEIIGSVKKGILLDYTGDSPNISTGDFSGLILHGALIEDGEIKHPLNETMLGINLLDLFQKIDAVSEEYQVFGSYRAPYVRIKEVNIIGSAK
ncbi:MAG: hypothetical protein GF317_18420 [Candidatus Lokiarchaeota archaeon]|nr:hypothetical protein [Candidatus Lokiarchaeota archaeon]MBD3201491.1 hypothetical protein [Candidatus Lokiarchaeota archaeon]